MHPPLGTGIPTEMKGGVEYRLCPTGHCPTGRCPQDAAPQDTAPQDTAPTGRCPIGRCPTGRCPQGAVVLDSFDWWMTDPLTPTPFAVISVIPTDWLFRAGTCEHRTLSGMAPPGRLERRGARGRQRQLHSPLGYQRPLETSARLEFAKLHVDKPQSFWENVLWTDETKMELFGKAHQLYVHRWKNEAYQEKNTLLWNMEEALLCSGSALLHLAQGVLNLCRVDAKELIGHCYGIPDKC
ncbi:hypothetical protein NFI96_022594 [Prochilodus magdalenae]|nr:hypothetical protein NFI96_022594 [Prochilodus magdalenae]